MRPLTDAQYALKAAVRRAVKLAGGPSAAAAAVRVDAPRLSRYGNPDAPEFAPIDVCCDLDRAAGDHVILRALADIIGCDLVPRETAEDRLARDVIAAAGLVAKDSGEVVNSAIQAVSDGRLTPAEARRFDEEAGDLEGRVVELRKVVRAAAV
jgi:hypothetical protein